MQNRLIWKYEHLSEDLNRRKSNNFELIAQAERAVQIYRGWMKGKE